MITDIVCNGPQFQEFQTTAFNLNTLLDMRSRPLCSISGGSDSDIMMHLIEQIRGDRPITYMFFDTGIEYRATHRHLDEREDLYGVKIERLKAKVPVPLGCKKYGQPFISKKISEYIYRLQQHGFQWEDESFDVLYARYPKCKAALRWWCNDWGEKSSFNINRNLLLKEFMIAHPPDFLISPKCCDGAKKQTAHAGDKIFQPDLKILGIRQAESGARSTSLHNCGFENYRYSGCMDYRPLFFWSDKDKELYKKHYHMSYSDAYENYGLKRTGCAGCPFGSGFEYELEVIRCHEPHLYRAVNSIFGDSYEYTRMYREFKAKHKSRGGHQHAKKLPANKE